MTQEQKELLLKDLCARLPYGVKFRYKYINNFFHEDYATSRLEGVLPPYHIIHSTLVGEDYLKIDDDEVRPYLFPLSSMTEEQKQALKNRFCYDWDYDDDIYELWKHQIEIGEAEGLIDWFHENHIDYRCLIPKGLAIDATGLNILNIY